MHHPTEKQISAMHDAWEQTTPENPDIDVGDYVKLGEYFWKVVGVYLGEDAAYNMIGLLSPLVPIGLEVEYKIPMALIRQELVYRPVVR